MISQRELAALRAEWSLGQDVIEKDYVLGWMLSGIAQNAELAHTWVFKGGTCLRKCYYETYRFSEDLDFTIIEGGPEEPADLVRIFADVATWVRDASGIDLVVDERSFRRARNKRGNATTLGKIAYRGPNGSPSMPKVKLDLTSDELLVAPPVLRPIGHPYRDVLPQARVLSYSIAELFGEKLRALAERCRPRDLYDVVHLHRHPDLIGRADPVRHALERKANTRVSRFRPQTRFARPRSEPRLKRNGRTCSGTSCLGRLSHSRHSGVPSTGSSAGSRDHRQPPSSPAQAWGS